MSSNEVPEPWRTRLVEKNFTDPRYADDRPSLSRLAEAMDMHTSTVSSAISGKRRASAATVTRLVEHLGEDVAGWLDSPAPRQWTPPVEAALLTDRQRKAIEELIKSMTERQEQRHGSQEEGTPIAHAAGSAADDDVPTPPSADELGLAAKRAERERAFDDQSEHASEE